MYLSRITPPQLFVAFLCVGLVGASSGPAQSDLAFEPYTVFVIDEDGHARCGPSDEYYRTDPLRHGQSLEVYAETDNGWLGVRPPSDSFCWIPADTVEMAEADDVGTIIEDRTVAWIGTHLGRARTYRWQVQLAEGEPVTVIGKSERDGPDGPQLWYRIVPPSGEYRWVHRDQVVMSSEELVAKTKTVSNSGQTRSSRESAEETGRTLRASPANRTALDRTASSRRKSPSRDNAPRGKARPSPQRSAEPAGGVAAAGSSVLIRQPEDQPAAEGAWESNEVRRSVAEAEQVDPATTIAFDDADQQNSNDINETVSEAMRERGLLASVEFIGRPRLIEIGGEPSAPRSDTPAGDSNWISGVSRRNPAPSHNAVAAIAPPPTQDASENGSENSEFNPIMQVSGQLPLSQQPITPTLAPTAAPTLKPVNYVSAERISEIQQQTTGAGIDQLSLVFSRLMATSASAVEAEPVTRAARTLASMSTDPVVAGRARLLAERAEQYQRLATRRDGPAVIRTTAGIEIPFSPPVSGTGQSPPPGQGSTSVMASHSGYLVQVYSARSNSPPFALTDNVGRTLAYVTPSPGVNLRNHLNSKITVTGMPGYVTGLNTPHIVASGVVRTPE